MSAVLFAVMALPLMVAVGAAVDGLSLFEAQSLLSNATDAAALAMGAAPTGTSTDDLEKIGSDYLAGNFPNTDRITRGPLEVNFGDNDNVIDASATATVKTPFMSLVGIDNITVKATSQVTRKVTGVELAMVLDNTGSMWTNNNIQALRESATNVVNIMFGSESDHPLLRIAIVPYSISVNLGVTLSDGQVLASKLVDSPAHPFNSSKNTKDWKGCVLARESPHDLDDTNTADGGYWQQYWWVAAVDNNWKNSDINEDTKSLGNGVHGPNIGCPTAVTPLTGNKATLTTAINAITAWNRGGTMGNVGMVWGLRLLSPNSTYLPTDQRGYNWNTTNWVKAVILMTDGDNLVYELTSKDGVNNSNPNTNSDYTSYGFLDQNRLGTTSNKTTAKNTIDSKLSSVCTTMKDEGIIVYTVVFTSGISDATKNIYKNCASDPGKYFYAPSQDDLKASFNAIGLQLANLRISQ